MFLHLPFVNNIIQGHDNYGQIYILQILATHGRGMYKSGSFVPRNNEGINEEVDEVLEKETLLHRCISESCFKSINNRFSF